MLENFGEMIVSGQGQRDWGFASEQVGGTVTTRLCRVNRNISCYLIIPGEVDL